MLIFFVGRFHVTVSHSGATVYQ